MQVEIDVVNRGIRRTVTVAEVPRSGDCMPGLIDEEGEVIVRRVAAAAAIDTPGLIQVEAVFVTNRHYVLAPGLLLPLATELDWVQLLPF